MYKARLQHYESSLRLRRKYSFTPGWELTVFLALPWSTIVSPDWTSLLLVTRKCSNRDGRQASDMVIKTEYILKFKTSEDIPQGVVDHLWNFWFSYYCNSSENCIWTLSNKKTTQTNPGLFLFEKCKSVASWDLQSRLCNTPWLNGLLTSRTPDSWLLRKQLQLIVKTEQWFMFEKTLYKCIWGLSLARGISMDLLGCIHLSVQGCLVHSSNRTTFKSKSWIHDFLFTYLKHL